MNTAVQNDSQGIERRGRTPALALSTCGIFVMLTLVLVLVDFVPEPPKTSAEKTTPTLAAEAAFSDRALAPMVAAPKPSEIAPALPVRVRIPSIGVDATVMTPESTDVDVLDRALTVGAVRYPGSALLGEDGNVLIFGHSSYLPVVKNKAYQAFNELGALHPGDVIEVHATAETYVYRVKEVKLVKAAEATIVFAASDPMLTLATCNTFGAKQDRWVVTASLADILPIGS